MKKIVRIILLVILGLIITFFIIFSLLQNNVADQQKRISTTFPESYKPYIQELKSQHPNWEFKALYTNLDWNYVIGKENVYGKNLVPKSYSDSWKNTKKGEYNVEIDAGWVDSSKQAVEYAMDPRNFLNSVRVFQFEELSYNSNTNNVSNIEKILYGTEFYNKIVEYKTSTGSNVVTNKKYSDLILTAAKTSDVSGFHLASRIKQEVGPFLSHSSISGTVEGYKGLYNFYNIGATSSSEPLGAIKNGLQFAKDGKGASSSTKSKYLIPWNTKEKAITGGAIFIGSSYINLGQNTIYLQKFHIVDNSGDDNLFWHQYMTNVLAPYSESKLIYNGYSNSQMLNSSNSFIVPIYENLPELPCISPAINSKDYISDNKKVYSNVSGSLNIRTGPGTSYDVITSVSPKEVMTRIAKGRQTGELWDRVRLENGIVGYVFQNYIKEVKDIPIEQIKLSLENTTLQKGENANLKVEITPSNATNKTLEYTSNNSGVVTVDSTGKLFGVSSGKATITAKAKNGVTASIDVTVYSKVTGIKLKEQDLCLEVGQSYNVVPIILPEDANNKKVNYYSSEENIATIDQNGKLQAISNGNTTIKAVTEEGNFESEIMLTVIPKLEEGAITFESPLQVTANQITGIEEKTTVKELLEKIRTDYRLEVLNKSNEILAEEKFVGTESKIRVYDEDNLIIEYRVIIYGDVNGDGKINSIDLLVLQRHILELKPLEGMFLKAGNIAKNGKSPSSVDLLKIQRHILNLKQIEQTSSVANIQIQAKTDLQMPNEEASERGQSATLANQSSKTKNSVIELKPSKETVKKDEEFTVTINAKNLNVAAYDINLHFDSNKLELISEAENINEKENNLLYTWFDEKGEKTINENKELAKFNFKAKEDGVNNFSLEGNFYNEQEKLLQPKIEVAEVKIGETINTSEENAVNTNQSDNIENTNNSENIIQNSDPNNANLAVLRLDKPGIIPDFKADIKEYYITVNESVQNLEITTIPENSNSTINITGNQNLKSGLNTIIIKVNSENSKKQTEYKIYVTKTANEETANAKLETLAIENATLEHDFIENITDYTAVVDNNVQNLNILAIPQNENAKVEIAGANNLKIGDNNITVTVYAENGVTFKKYKITVHRRNEKEQKEQEEKQAQQNNNANIEKVSTIDNSTQIVDVRQKNIQLQSQNSLWLICGILLAMLVLGIVVIRIFKKMRKLQL